MSPYPADEGQAEAKGPSGFAAALRGLTGGKLSKSSLTPSSPASTPSHQVADLIASLPTIQEPPRYLDLTDLLARLKNGSIQERTEAAGALRYEVIDHLLSPVFDIWHTAKDLVDTDMPADTRVAGWALLTACVKCPGAGDLDRLEYFSVLTAPAHPDDFYLQLAALEDLADHGRNVSGFEYHIYPLLTQWLQTAYQAAKSARREASRAAAQAKPSSKGKAIWLGEEQNLSQLWTFVKDVIRFNFKYSSDKVIGNLVDMALFISRNTSTREDLRACVGLVDTLVTYGAIPNEQLLGCVQILTSIHWVVASLLEDAWQTLVNICRSHHGQSVVRILLDALKEYEPAPDDPAEGMDPKAKRDEDAKKAEAIRKVRGPMAILRRLMAHSGDRTYPSVPLMILINGLANCSRTTTPKILADILKIITSLLQGPGHHVNELMVDEDWTEILSVAARCAERGRMLAEEGKAVKRTKECSSSTTSLYSSKDEPVEDTVAYQEQLLVIRVQQLLNHEGPEFFQRDECVGFLIQGRHTIPDSAAAQVLGYLADYRSCCPPSDNWPTNLQMVLHGFFLDRARSPNVRLQASILISQAYDILVTLDDVGELNERHVIQDLVTSILTDMLEETDGPVMKAIVDLTVKVATRAPPDLFDQIIDTMDQVVSRARMRVSTFEKVPRPGTPSTGPSSASVVAAGYVQIFIRVLEDGAYKAGKMFNALVRIAQSNNTEADARLTAMKLLFRLRADYDHRIFIFPHPECEIMATLLRRTAAPPAPGEKGSGSGTDQGVARLARTVSVSQQPWPGSGPPSRSNNVPLRQGAEPLWFMPDADALPEPVPSEPSLVVFSHQTAEIEGTVTLPLSSWLEALQNLLSGGCHWWEVCSFILAHLPTQLANHSLFKGAIPQIRDLRRVVCELLRGALPMPEPPFGLGLRKPDVSNCLYHALTVLISYHQHYLKTEEDEIIKSFMMGVHDKTAKTCIHALSLCCHELPLSVGQSLVGILERMSQIITRPFVAIHILEFLTCLSRMHALYGNFREDDFRIVFGICVRYLQYVRDRKHAAARASVVTTSSGDQAATPDGNGQQHSVSDDLPQYVYALAFHVITFWYLALRISDRPKHIGWIAKNLCTDIDGAPSNEVHAQITLDFMQRVAFSDAGDSGEDPMFTEEHYGEIARRRWIMGNSIITIKQAKKSGWTEITRRFPSGTTSFHMRARADPTPAHQEDDPDHYHARSNTTLPSHLLINLLAPIPQVPDRALRPIPLPDEEQVDRAIRTFDLVPAIDGHKIGVVYIDNEQSTEKEILANTMGSPDYHEFLGGLGTLTKLKRATFNTQGLDRRMDLDGQYTYCWRDRVTEVVFHVTTLMPTNLERDPLCIAKKRHIGNDFVNIIFNDSGQPFKFETFPSEFNYVNIVIQPSPRLTFIGVRERARAREKAEARKRELQDKQDGEQQQQQDGDADVAGPDGGDASVQPQEPVFLVQVMGRPGFPEISPAAVPKIVSLTALPSFVRALAINASVFSQVWSKRSLGDSGEHVSSWRNRLYQINRLRERYGGPRSDAPPPPSTSSAIGPGAQAGTGPQSSAATGPNSLGLGQLQPSVGGAGGGGGGGTGSMMNNGAGPAAIGSGSVGGPGGFGGISCSSTPSVLSGLSGDPGRPASSGMRDSFSSSMRRSSVATFFTMVSGSTTTGDTSQRSSMLSTSAAPTVTGFGGGGSGVNGTAPGGGGELVLLPGDAAALVDSVDFSQWA